MYARSLLEETNGRYDVELNNRKFETYELKIENLEGI